MYMLCYKIIMAFVIELIITNYSITVTIMDYLHLVFDLRLSHSQEAWMDLSGMNVDECE